MGSGDSAGIWQREHNRDNAITMETPSITIWTREGADLTADQARALASELVAAAFLLDEITAGQR